jgi:hypothetical protein
MRPKAGGLGLERGEERRKMKKQNKKLFLDP